MAGHGLYARGVSGIGLSREIIVGTADSTVEAFYDPISHFSGYFHFSTLENFKICRGGTNVGARDAFHMFWWQWTMRVIELDYREGVA